MSAGPSRDIHSEQNGSSLKSLKVKVSLENVVLFLHQDFPQLVTRFCPLELAVSSQFRQEPMHLLKSWYIWRDVGTWIYSRHRKAAGMHSLCWYYLAQTILPVHHLKYIYIAYIIWFCFYKLFPLVYLNKYTNIPADVMSSVVTSES